MPYGHKKWSLKELIPDFCHPRGPGVKQQQLHRLEDIAVTWPHAAHALKGRSSVASPPGLQTVLAQAYNTQQLPSMLLRAPEASQAPPRPPWRLPKAAPPSAPLLSMAADDRAHAQVSLQQPFVLSDWIASHKTLHDPGSLVHGALNVLFLLLVPSAQVSTHLIKQFYGA